MSLCKEKNIDFCLKSKKEDIILDIVSPIIRNLCS